RIRVRLRADTTGIAVTGPLHTRRIPWGRIHSISAPQRGRFGRRASVLEIEVRPDGGAADHAADTAGAGDTGDADDELLTFGRFDLGTDPADVCRQLLRRL
ncbi:MAG TPA: PH domain-containing protein, partial [Nakamurella sp.]|nr:PH domain-containing protein [Nakamurella sp.]